MTRQDGRCNRCGAPDAATRHSFSVYAGFLCYRCAVDGYVDSCGLRPEGQGNPAELDEPLDPDWEGPGDLFDPEGDL